MRAPTITLALALVLALAAPAPALADAPAPAPAPPPAGEPATEAPAPAPADAPAPAPAPIVPPAVTRPTAGAAEDPGPPPRRYGYRWQIIGSDAAAIAMSVALDRISAGGGGRPGPLATLTIASYFFTAPLLHGVHRQGLRALASFGLRAGLPLVLGLLGEQIDGTPECDICEDTLRSDGKLAGLTAGVLIAMAIDGALIARPIHRRLERPQTVWAPALGGVRGGATAGVSGTF